jgi:O-antigen/teichoic acid export membrane protein
VTSFRRAFKGGMARWFSGESLTRKAFLNGFASVLDYGARLLVGFILNPLLVTFLGAYGYGAWRILERLISYLSPASGRPTQALQWTIAKQQASVDFQEKRRQVGSALVVWLLFLPLSVALGAVLVWFVPTWLDAPTNLTRGVRVAAALLVADLVVMSLVNIPRSVLLGENLGYKRMGLSTFLVFTGGGLTALALILETGLVGVAAAALATTLLTGALFMLVVRVQVAWFGVARPAARAIRQFLGLSGWFLGWNLVMKLLTASDIVVLGIFDSVESVAAYSLTKYTPETLVSLVAMVVFGVTPGLGGIIGAGDLEKAARVRAEIMVLTWLIGTALGATVLVWNGVFVPLWVGEGLYAGALPTLLITVMMLQFTFIRNDANIIDLTLELRTKVLLGLVSGVLSLGLAIVLLRVFDLGIVGLCAGFIVGRLILSAAYPLLVGRFLRISLTTQLRSIVRPALVTTLLFGLGLGASRALSPVGWYGFLPLAALTLGITLLTAFYTGLSGEQRTQLWHRFRRVAQRV